MFFKHFLPQKKKIVLSLLIPFSPVLLMPSFLINVPENIPDIVLVPWLCIQLFIMILAYGIIMNMAYPLVFILEPLGMWEHSGSMYIGLAVPRITVPGMILTALVYSILLYIFLSFKSFFRERRLKLNNKEHDQN